MWAGRMEDARSLLLSHGWVIATVFNGKPHETEIENFLQYGIASEGESNEYLSPLVHEKVAQAFREGKVVFG